MPGGSQDSLFVIGGMPGDRNVNHAMLQNIWKNADD
ncbi:DinI-like family protein [Rahnella sp. WP5]